MLFLAALAFTAPAAAVAPRLLPAVNYPAASWTTKTAAQVNLDSADLTSLQTATGNVAGVVVRDGYLIHTWGTASAKFDWASASKPVLSTLLFFALHESLVPTVDEVLDVHRNGFSAPDQAITWRHVANMLSGYAVADAPGAKWDYNDYGVMLFATTLCDDVFADDAEAIASDEARLGALDFQDGTIFGGGANDYRINTSPRDMARIGWFWLNEGRWSGGQILPRSFFDTFASVHVASNVERTAGGAVDDYLALGSYGGGANQTEFGPGEYGFAWWHNANGLWPSAPRDTFCANGHSNREVCVIIPSLRLVAAWKDDAISDDADFADDLDALLAILVGAVQ